MKTIKISERAYRRIAIHALKSGDTLENSIEKILDAYEKNPYNSDINIEQKLLRYANRLLAIYRLLIFFFLM